MIDDENTGYLFQQVRRDGWHFSPKPEEGWKTITYKGTYVNIELLVSFSDEWVCFQSPIADPIGEKDKERFYEFLLSINNKMFLTKFSLDEQGKVILLSEYPRANFDSYVLNDILHAVEKYAVNPFSNLEFYYSLINNTSQGLARSHRMLTDEKIKSFFYGVFKKNWIFLSEPVDYNWKGIYKGKYRDFDIAVTFSPEWVYFQSPILRQPIETSFKTPLYEYLLRLNERMFIGKFGLDGEQLVVLSVEFPTNDFNFKVFMEGAESMSNYLEKFSYEINLLALESEIADLSIGKKLNLDALANPKEIFGFSNIEQKSVQH